MGSMALTGADSVILNDRIFKDFADGDTGKFSFPNKLVEAKPGKNGNVIFAFNAQGILSEAEIRVLRASSDDKFLNSQMNAYINDPAAYTPMTGEFIKRVGDGQGNVSNEVYQFAGGVVTNIPEARENVSGETEQAVTVWKITFANTSRSIT